MSDTESALFFCIDIKQVGCFYYFFQAVQVWSRRTTSPPSLVVCEFHLSTKGQPIKRVKYTPNPCVNAYNLKSLKTNLWFLCMIMLTEASWHSIKASLWATVACWLEDLICIGEVLKCQVHLLVSLWSGGNNVLILEQEQRVGNAVPDWSADWTAD